MGTLCVRPHISTTHAVVVLALKSSCCNKSRASATIGEVQVRFANLSIFWDTRLPTAGANSCKIPIPLEIGCRWTTICLAFDAIATSAAAETGRRPDWERHTCTIFTGSGAEARRGVRLVHQSFHAGSPRELQLRNEPPTKVFPNLGNVCDLVPDHEANPQRHRICAMTDDHHVHDHRHRCDVGALPIGGHLVRHSSRQDQGLAEGGRDVAVVGDRAEVRPVGDQEALIEHEATRHPGDLPLRLLEQALRHGDRQVQRHLYQHPPRGFRLEL
mmetsp:Transcript_157409/g.501721  ORF Transcript_157409/g.501721 Transcript_157409/m.501721 type:complete len:272 (-) Transcript_157409:3015-3830(-)